MTYRRNPAFTGRGQILAELAGRRSQGAAVVTQALQGGGGVGKTALAVEYASGTAPSSTPSGGFAPRSPPPWSATLPTWQSRWDCLGRPWPTSSLPWRGAPLAASP